MKRPSTAGRGGVRVLLSGQDIIEDSRLADFLSRLGANGFEKSVRYHEFLKALENEQFDLVLTDLSFGSCGDRDVLAQVRQENFGQPLLVVRAKGGEIDLEDDLVLEWPAEYPDFAQRVLRVAPTLNQEQSDLLELLKRDVRVERVMSLSSGELAQRSLQFDLAHALHAAGRIDHSTAMWLELVFQEAIANAHEHGNLELASEWREELDSAGQDRFSATKTERLNDRSYSERKLSIITRFEQNELVLEVKDQGTGFCRLQSFDSEQCAESIKVHGRGLSIIHSVMDKVEYREHGSRLIARKAVENKG